MNIGHFLTHFPYINLLNDANYVKRYTHGGIGIVAHYLSIEMVKRRHGVNIFTTSINSKDSFERLNGVNIYRYGTNFKIGNGNISFNLLLKPPRHKVDIVHAHSPSPPSDMAALRYVSKWKVPFVLTYHGDGQENIGNFIRNTSVSFYNRYVLDKFMSRADVIISPSKHYIDESRFLGKYRDKTVVIPNGINIDDFDVLYSRERCREKLGLPIDSKIILFVGTLIQHKGHGVLLKAVPKILKNIPNAKLVFVGDGGMKEELERICKRLNVEKHVKFAGFVGDISKKPLYYRAADVFVLPSTGPELFGIVNLEAMACGIPIVASKIGGIPDIVKDGENGLLVPPRNSKVLADAIIYLLENEDIREKMGKNGREKVEDYSWEMIAEETEKVYLSLMECEQ